MYVLDISRNLLVTPTFYMDPTAGGLYKSALEELRAQNWFTFPQINFTTHPLDGGVCFIQFARKHSGGQFGGNIS